MDKKLRIAVAAGGFSGESVVSLRSAQTIMEGLKNPLFEPILVQVLDDAWTVEYKNSRIPVNKEDFTFSWENNRLSFDFVFIIIHGTPGEDGIMQAYFDLVNIPYSTADSTVMGLTFDKAFTQSVLKARNYNVANNIILKIDDDLNRNFLDQTIGYPCFVKPARAGSSLGISKVKSERELDLAIEKAFNEHHTLLIESNLDGREITCAAYISKGEVKSLPVTEILCQNDFFDYEAKYLDQETQEITPAQIPDDIRQKCQKLTRSIYQEFNCKGVVRVDYMLVEDQLFVIELNTIPGMSKESIVPKQLAAAKIEIGELLLDVIQDKLELVVSNLE